MIYIGSFFGYLIVSFFIDNTGRKFSMLGSLIISVIGVFIVNISQSLFMAEIGLFISGFGIDSAINISFYFIT
jgi:fucose permease